MKMANASEDVRTPLSERGGDASHEIDMSKLKVKATAAFLATDEATVTGLPDDIVAKIYAKSNELDAIKSRKMLEQINWEESLHSAEEKVEMIQKRFQQATNDKEALESAIQSIGAEKAQLEKQLQSVQGTNFSEEGAVKVLQAQLESLRADNARLLDFLERRKTEVNEYRAELDVAQAKFLEARKSIVQLETQAETSRAENLAAKLKEQSLSQEIELLRKSNGWLDDELKAKSKDFKTFRTSTIERISALQVQVSTLSSEQQSQTRAHDQLKDRYQDINAKYESAAIKIKDLESMRAISEENFRNEMASQQKLCELWEKSAKESRSRVEELEELLRKATIVESEEVNKWRSLAEKETLRADNLAEKFDRIEKHLESKLTDNGSGRSTPMSPLVSTPQGPVANGVGFMSPSAEVIGKLQKRGISLVQLYSDFQETKILLEREKAKNSTLRDEMDQIVAEMDSHAPEILNERLENERMQLNLAEMSSKLEKSQASVQELSSKVSLNDAKLKDSRRERDLLYKQVRDLSRQVRCLLIRVTDNDTSAMSVEEKQNLEVMLRRADLAEDGAGGENDSDLLISERLVVFNDVIELQRQNEHLLKVARQLTSKMEQEEQESQRRLEDLESTAVEEAKQAILYLQDDIRKLKVKSDALKQERDMFRDMLNGRKSLGDKAGITGAQNGHSDSEIARLVQQNQETMATLTEIRSSFENYKMQSNSTNDELNKELRVARDQRADLQLKLSRTEGQLELTIERLENAKQNVSSLQAESGELRKRTQQLQEALAKQDVRTQQAAAELIEVRSLLDSTRTETANLRAERSLWKAVEGRLAKENSDLLQDKGRLNGLLSNMTVSSEEREAAFKSTEKALNQRINELVGQIKKLERSLDMEKENLTALNNRRDAENSDNVSKISKLNNDIASTHKTIYELKETVNQLEAQKRELSTQVNGLQEKVALYEKSERGESIKMQADRLASLQTSLASKEEELRLANEQIASLTDIARAAEEALENLTQSNDEFKKDMEQRIAEKEVCFYFC